MVSKEHLRKGIKCCPIETAFEHIGKKWSINIIRDLFTGKRKFKEFLIANPELSGKVLSQRLKELEKEGLITKNIVSKTPLRAEYELTKKGKTLDKVLYEMIVFSIKSYSKDVFKSNKKIDNKLCINMARKYLK